MAKTKTLTVQLEGAPHAGTPEYRQKATWVETRVIDGELRQCQLTQVTGGQHLLIKLAQKYPTFTGPVGRRFGKTSSIPFLAIDESQEQADRRGIYRIGIFSQDHTKRAIMYEQVLEFFGGGTPKSNPMLLKAFKGQAQDSELHIRAIPLGNRPCRAREIHFFFWSGQHPAYEKVRGYPFPFSRIVIDEASLMHPKILDVVNAMLADARGKLLVIGTPDVDQPGNAWFESYYLKGLDESETRFGCMNFPTMANPHLDRMGIEDAKSRCLTEASLRQEIYAEFLSGEGAVFHNIDAILCLPHLPLHQPPAWYKVIQAEHPLETMDAWISEEFPAPEEGHYYIATADWAKSADRTVITLLNMTRKVQVAAFASRSHDFTKLAPVIKRIIDTFKVQRFHGDENTGAGQYIHDYLRAHHNIPIIGHRFNTYNKGDYVARTQSLFWKGKIKLLDFPAQRIEFKQYRRIDPDASKGMTNVRYAHPPGGHDDFVDPILQASEDLEQPAIPARVEVDPRKRLIDDEGQFDLMAFYEDDEDDVIGEMLRAQLEQEEAASPRSTDEP